MNSNFDWSSLDRYSVAAYVWILAPKIVGRDLTPNQFYRVMSQHLKKCIPLRFQNQINEKVLPGYVYIGGLYFIEKDENEENPIKLIFQYKSKQDTIYITNSRFWKMCLIIADTLLHEIIHMRQHRRRNFRCLDDYDSEVSNPEKKQEQIYLGCPDEIDAYSFNIACELMEKFDGNKKKILKYLNEDHKAQPYKHNCWRMYLKTFDHDHKHPVIKKLKKRVIYYLKAAERGYPYKSSKWINY